MSVKRLRVKTGGRAPAVIGLVPTFPSDGVTVTSSSPLVVTYGRSVVPDDMLSMSINMTPLVPLIRCTMPVPCGSCWYCKRARTDGHPSFDWELPF